MITDGIFNYKIISKIFEEKKRKLFWFSYVVHCLNLIFEDIKKILIFYDAIIKPKQVKNFIYKNSCVFNFNSYKKIVTDKELIRLT